MEDYLRDNLNGTYTYLPADGGEILIEAANLAVVEMEFFNLFGVPVFMEESHEDIDLFVIRVRD